MYAIIETGGKQYRVEEGSKIVVEKLAGEAGSEIKLDKVLMLGGADVKVGAPYVENAAVTAEVVEQAAAPRSWCSSAGVVTTRASCAVIVRTAPPSASKALTASLTACPCGDARQSAL